MREIKFRGQDVFTKKWVYGYFSECVEPMDEPVCLSCITDIENNSWVAYPETVGQYTGLKDKYDNEIYEGDICWDDEEECYGEVRFLDGGFSYIWQNICVDLFEIDDSIEIVGNIYEDTDLIH